MSKYIQKCGDQLKVDKAYVDYVAQSSVAYVIDSGCQNLVYIHKGNIMTLKPGNIFIDLKGTLTAALEVFTGYQNPVNIFGMLQLIFLIIFSIKDVINVKLPKGTETVIITLYKNDGFVKAIDEEKLFRETKLSLNVGESLNKKQFSDIILFLDKYHVIECIDGTIQLKEKVFGKDFI